MNRASRIIATGLFLKRDQYPVHLVAIRTTIGTAGQASAAMEHIQ